MTEVIFHDDLLPKLISYLDSRQAAFLMRIDESQRSELDKDRFRRMIQEKREEEEMKRELIVTAGRGDKIVRVQDKEGKCLKKLTGHTGRVLSAAFNTEGSLIVSASNDTTIRIWDAQSGECLRVLNGHDDTVFSAEFNKEDSLIVSAGIDKTIKVWDAQTGEILRVLRGHDRAVRSAAFNTEGSLIVSASADKTIRVWDARTGECLRVLNGHTEIVISTAFNTEGTLIVSASWDETIRLWDARTGESLRVLEGHDDWVLSAEFNTEGTKIVSASQDKTIRIWDARTGECLRVLEGHDLWVRSAAFNTEGSLIVSASADATIRLWDAQNGVCLKVIQADASKVSFGRSSQNPANQECILDKVEFIKRKGNDLFRNKLISHAILKYLESLALFKDETTTPAKEIRSSINSKIALCYTKLSNYTESLYYAERAMISNRSNTKAQYRICESLYHLRRLEEANERVNAFLTADPDNNELKKIRNKIRELLLNDR